MAKKEKTLVELHDFGQVMTLACLIFSAVGVWKRQAFTGTVLVLLILGVFFFSLAAFYPEKLRNIERIWMAFAEKLGMVMTFIVMLITFYLIVTPCALMMRLLGRDLLQRKLEKDKLTYWEPVEENGPGSRPFLPY